MSYSNVIGEQKAKDIARYIVLEAKQKALSEHFYNLAWFVQDGEQISIPNAVLEMINELSIVRSKGILISYDDTNKLRDYFEKFLPNMTQLAVFYHYGYDKLKDRLSKPQNEKK